MTETISVDEAIRKGQKMVNYPVSIIQIGTIILGIYLCYRYGLPVWGYVCVLPSAVILPWIYWSFMITKWRIWAFGNVRNVHELKDRAIKGKLIWKDGSAFEKTEIRTSADKVKLQAIQKKFDQPDI